MGKTPHTSVDGERKPIATHGVIIGEYIKGLMVYEGVYLTLIDAWIDSRGIVMKVFYDLRVHFRPYFR